MTPQANRGWSARLGRVSARQVDLALAVLVTLAGLVLFAYSGIGGNRRAGFLFLQNIELRTLDLRFALRGTRPHDDRVVIVGIDEKTLQKLGSFPLPRNSYAQLVESLSGAGAGVIAFDATFPTPESNSALAALQKLQAEIAPGTPASFLKKIRDLEAASDQDAVFAAALKQSGNVVLGHLFLDEQRARLSDPKKAEEYFNVAWAKAFPQVLKVKSKDGRDFDLGKSWIENGGTVAAGAEANIAKLAEAASSYGFIDINPDPDGTLRHALLIMRYQDQDFFPSLALQSVREYEKIPDQEIAAYIAETGLERIQFGKHLLLPSRDGTALINYTGPYRTYPQYSMADVIDGTVPPERAQRQDRAGGRHRHGHRRPAQYALPERNRQLHGSRGPRQYHRQPAAQRRARAHVSHSRHSRGPHRRRVYRAVWPWIRSLVRAHQAALFHSLPGVRPGRIRMVRLFQLRLHGEGGSALSSPPARWWPTTP